MVSGRRRQPPHGVAAASTAGSSNAGQGVQATPCKPNRRLSAKSPSSNINLEQEVSVDRQSEYASRLSCSSLSKVCESACALGVSFSLMQGGNDQRQKRRRLRESRDKYDKEPASNKEAKDKAAEISEVLHASDVCVRLADPEQVMTMPKQALSKDIADLKELCVPIEPKLRLSLAKRNGVAHASAFVEARETESVDKVFDVIDAWDGITARDAHVEALDDFQGDAATSQDALWAATLIAKADEEITAARKAAEELYVTVLLKNVLIPLMEKADQASKASIVVKLLKVEAKLLECNAGTYTEAAEANGIITGLVRAAIHTLVNTDHEYTADYYDAMQMKLGKKKLDCFAGGRERVGPRLQDPLS